MQAYRGEYLPGNPVFAAGSAALCSAHTGPVNIDCPGIVYSKADDEAIENYNRNFGICLLNILRPI
jgi:alcohol oxidase